MLFLLSSFLFSSIIFDELHAFAKLDEFLYPSNVYPILHGFCTNLLIDVFPYSSKYHPEFVLKYVKNVIDVDSEGRTEVVITEDDYVEEEGDFWDKVNKWFNGD